jgi:hypothetical protein
MVSPYCATVSQIAPLLADVGALAELVASFSAAVADDRGSLAAVDLNPVLVAQQGSGVRAVDAAILRTMSAETK